MALSRGDCFRINRSGNLLKETAFSRSPPLHGRDRYRGEGCSVSCERQLILIDELQITFYLTKRSPLFHTDSRSVGLPVAHGSAATTMVLLFHDAKRRRRRREWEKERKDELATTRRLPTLRLLCSALHFTIIRIAFILRAMAEPVVFYALNVP